MDRTRAKQLQGCQVLSSAIALVLEKAVAWILLVKGTHQPISCNLCKKARCYFSHYNDRASRFASFSPCFIYRSQTKFPVGYCSKPLPGRKRQQWLVTWCRPSRQACCSQVKRPARLAIHAMKQPFSSIDPLRQPCLHSLRKGADLVPTTFRWHCPRRLPGICDWLNLTSVATLLDQERLNLGQLVAIHKHKVWLCTAQIADSLFHSFKCGLEDIYSVNLFSVYNLPVERLIIEQQCTE